MRTEFKTWRRWLVAPLAATALLTSLGTLASEGGAAPANAAQYQRWIAEMKEQPRGPFAAIKWFCKDGRVLPPKDYDCTAKGKGWQHGEWSERTKQMRAQGYEIATLLAGLDVERKLADPAFAERYAMWVVEKFLVAADDGWILRKAQFYRGAVQEEDEREAARQLLAAMAARDEWAGRRFAALPLAGNLGSLNVSAAAAVACYEIARLRRGR